MSKGHDSTPYIQEGKCSGQNDRRYLLVVDHVAVDRVVVRQILVCHFAGHRIAGYRIAMCRIAVDRIAAIQLAEESCYRRPWGIVAPELEAAPHCYSKNKVGVQRQECWWWQHQAPAEKA